MEIEVNSGNYLNSKTAKEGDVVHFKSEGRKDKITLKDGREKEVYNFEVSIDGKDLIYTPNNKSLELFVQEWGKDSKKWLGKEFKVKIVTMEIRGQEIEVVRPIVLKAEKVN